MGAGTPFYRIVLRQELDRRSGNNPNYSLRAFAKSLELDATYLSKVLNEKQILSVENAERLSALLNLDGENRKSFVLSAAEEKRCNSVLKAAPDLTDCPSISKLQSL